MATPIELVHRDGVPVVCLGGDIDMRVIAERAGDLYAHTCEDDVIVDLAAVEAMDSPGLTVLLMTLQAATSVRMINVPPVVRKLVDVSSKARVLMVDAA